MGKSRKIGDPGVVDATVPPVGWTPPPVAATEHTRYPLLGSIVIVEELHLDVQRRLVGFARVLCRDDAYEGLVEIARVDCAHGTVHLHDGSRKIHLRHIGSHADIVTGYDQATDELFRLADSALAEDAT